MRFLTSQLFYLLVSKGESLKFLRGSNKGIGKSLGIILYNILSNPIYELNKFIRLNYEKLSILNWQKQLQNIDFSYPKVVYWNINIQDNIKIVQQTINQQLQQCEKLRNIKLDNSSQDSFISKYIKKINIRTQLVKKMSIRTLLVMDHINILSQVNKKYQKSLSQTLTKIQKTIIKQNYQKQVYIRCKLFKILIKKFNKVIITTSSNINRNYMKYYHSLQFRSNFWERIQFTQSLHFSSTIADLGQFLIVEIQKNFLQQRKYSQSTLQNKKQFKLLLKTIRQKFFQIRVENQYYLTYPLSITYIIQQVIRKFKKQNKSYYKFLIKLCKQNKIQQYLKKLAENIQAQTIYTINNTIDKFLLKQSNSVQCKKSILLTKLLFEANKISKQFLHQQQQFDKKWIIKIQNFTDIMSLQKFEQSIEKNIFNVDIIQKHFNCFLAPTSIIKIFKSRTENLYSNLIASNEPILKHIKGSSLGGFTQSVFIDNLLMKNSKIKYQLKSKNGQNKMIEYFYDGKNIDGFLPIPKVNQKNYSQYRFLDSFGQLIKKREKTKMTQSQSIEHYIFLPQIKSNYYENEQFQLGQINLTSKLIDFILVECISQTINIFLYDITISNDKFIDKCVRLMRQFLNFKDDKKQQSLLTINVSYIVLTPSRLKIYNNFKSILQKKIPQFEFIEHKNYYQVKSKTNNNINKLLNIKIIGQISYLEQIQYQNQTQQQMINLNKKLLHKCAQNKK